MEIDIIKTAGNSERLVKILLNEDGDYAVISLDDTTFFDRFAAGFKAIADKGDSVSQAAGEIEKKYGGRDDYASVMEQAVEASKNNVEFSREAVTVIDGIFGAGTVRKYYKNIYAEIPDFLPGADSIMDFLDQITPEIEKLFRRRVEVREAERKKRMEKYRPQDHKRRKTQ